MEACCANIASLNQICNFQWALYYDHYYSEVAAVKDEDHWRIYYWTEAAYKNMNTLNTALHSNLNIINSNINNQHLEVRNALENQHSTMMELLSSQHSEIGTQLTDQHNSIGNQLTKQHTSIGEQLTEQHNSVGRQLTDQHNSIGVSVLSRFCLIQTLAWHVTDIFLSSPRMLSGTTHRTPPHSPRQYPKTGICFWRSNEQCGFKSHVGIRRPQPLRYSR